MIKQEFDNVSRRLPYDESPEYISALITRCADNAVATVARRSAARRMGRRIAISVAASVAVIVVAAVSILYRYDSQLDTMIANIDSVQSFDELVASFSDEQVENLEYGFLSVADYNEQENYYY